MRVSAITEIQRVNRINRVILEVFGSLKVFFDGSCQSRSATCKMTGFRRDVEREMSSTRVCLKIRYSQISYNTIISPFQMAHNFQTPKKISNRIFFWKDICEDQLILSMAIDLGGKPIHFGPSFFFQYLIIRWNPNPKLPWNETPHGLCLNSRFLDLYVIDVDGLYWIIIY